MRGRRWIRGADDDTSKRRPSFSPPGLRRDRRGGNRARSVGRPRNEALRRTILTVNSPDSARFSNWSATRYVDRPDQAKLIEAALQAMAASLDPHSGYVSGSAYGALESALRGEVGMVGLAIGERGGALTVDERDGRDLGFEERASTAGDRIEAIDGERRRASFARSGGRADARRRRTAPCV